MLNNKRFRVSFVPVQNKWLKSLLMALIESAVRTAGVGRYQTDVSFDP